MAVAKTAVAVSPVKAARALLSVDVQKVDVPKTLGMLAETFAQADVKGEASAADEATSNEMAAALAAHRAQVKAREARRGEARVALAIGVFALTSRKIAAGKDIAAAFGTSAAYVSQVASDGRRLVALGSTSPAALATLVAARKKGAKVADEIVTKSLAATPAPVSDKPDARPRAVVVPTAVVRDVASAVAPSDGAPVGRPARGEIRLSALVKSTVQAHERLTDPDQVVAGSEADRTALLNALERYSAAIRALSL